MLIASLCALLAAAPNPQLAQAEQLISDIRYAEAEKALAAAWAVPNNPRPVTLRILELQGIVASVLGRPQARDYFQRLLAIAPDHKLPEGQPPRVRTPFYEAKGMLSEAPPTRFSASASVDADGVRLSAVTADPLGLGRKVRFHTRKGEAWRQTDVPLVGLAPTVSAGRGTIWWWAELLGENDGALLLAGSEEEPFVAQAPELAVPLAAEAEPKPQPAERAVAAGPSRPVLVPVLLWSGAAAALGLGIGLGAASSGAYAQVNAAERDSSGVVTGMTQQEAAALRETGRAEAAVANVLFVSAAVLTGAGVLVFVLTPAAPVAIAPAPGGVAVSGTF